MKALLVLLLVLFIQPVHSKIQIVGVSPYWDEQSHQLQFVAVMKFASNLDAGDSVILIDAFNLARLGAFVIPEGKIYESPKFRLQKNGKIVAALKNLNQAASGQSRVSGAIRLPHFLKYVAANYPDADSTSIAIIGSSFYDSVNEPAFSMLNGFVPNDTNIVASESQSIFGTRGFETLLEGRDIHIAYLNSQITSSRHEYYLKRFYTLYIENLGGRLATFTSEIPVMLDRAWNAVNPLPHGFELKPTDQLLMKRLRIGDSKIPIHMRKLSHYQLSDTEIRNAKDVQISAVWNCKCDIDLYARGSVHAGVLSFQNQNSDEGWYFKDERQQGSAIKTYETIEFYKSIDLSSTQIALAFYGGAAPNGVAGEIRLAVGSHAYAMPFHIDASSGGKTSGVKESFAQGKATKPHIIMINPLDIVSQKH